VIPEAALFLRIRYQELDKNKLFRKKGTICVLTSGNNGKLQKCHLFFNASAML
jgi:hypothetical protein